MAPPPPHRTFFAGWRRVVGLLVFREYHREWAAVAYGVGSGPLFDAVCAWELHEELRVLQLLGLPRLPRP